MSTRSVVAVAKGDGWAGVYVHGDGYPTYGGRRWWYVFQRYCGGNVTIFADWYITPHPGGYSSAGNECYCHDQTPGAWSDKRYTDADEQEHALHIEWVYVFSARVLTVFTHAYAGGTHTEVDIYGEPFDSPNYQWVLVGQWPLDGPEPDWQQMEAHPHG